MKNFSRFSILVLVLMAAAGSALAVDLATNGLVEIVDGIVITEDTPLNFGTLVLNSGSVVVAAADGTVTDTDALVFDNTGISQGVFTVQSVAGADVEVAATPGGGMPSGLTLGSFTWDWEGGAATTATHTLSTNIVELEVGASLTVDAATASVSGGQENLPYTLSITFQ